MFGWFYLPALILACLLVLPFVRHIFIASGWRWVYVAFLSWSISFCSTPLFGWTAHRFHVLDIPDQRKVHETATPLLGGGAVFLGFMGAFFINGIFSQKLLAVLMASGILFIIGFMDDFREISAGIKLSAQMLCTGIVIWSGITLRIFPDHLGMPGTIGNWLLTTLWVVGITNAFNFFDGMDGLAVGMGAIISFFLGVVAFQTRQPFLGWVSISMLGSCIGFLPYNFKKNGAVIFLGDAGSTVIGFILACVAVYGEWSPTHPVTALVPPVLIFWVLIFDMVHITIDRILTGKVKTLRQWIEYVGKDHLHHRLAAILGGNKQSVLFIYLLTICLGTGAIVLRQATPNQALVLVLQASVIVVLITVLERRGRSLADDSPKKNQTKQNQMGKETKKISP
jgi:UDP-GlcNAc:undecaprenyl-phosphate GlcNAc-1-phosphate transferase